MTSMPRLLQRLCAGLVLLPMAALANFDSTVSYQLRDFRSVPLRVPGYPSLQVETWISVTVRTFALFGEPVVQCVGTWRVSDEPASGTKPRVQLITAQLAFPVALGSGGGEVMLPCDLGALGKGDGMDRSLNVPGSPKWDQFLLRWDSSWPKEGMAKPFWWESQGNFLPGTQIKPLAKVGALSLLPGEPRVLHLAFDLSEWEAELAEKLLNNTVAKRAKASSEVDRIAAVSTVSEAAVTLVRARQRRAQVQERTQQVRSGPDLSGLATACLRAIASQGLAQVSALCRKSDLDLMRARLNAFTGQRRELAQLLNEPVPAPAPVSPNAAPPLPKPKPSDQQAAAPAEARVDLAASVAAESAAPKSASAPTSTTQAPPKVPMTLEEGGRRWSRPVLYPMPRGQREMRQVEAVEVCTALELDGLKGWRVPSITELKALFDSGKLAPVLDPWRLRSFYVWSSSPEDLGASYKGSFKTMALNPEHPGTRISWGAAGQFMGAICVTGP